MDEPSQGPFFRVQTVLAICVQLASLAGAACFVVAIALNSAVFSLWDLNFLQLATTGDVINSGLDIFFRMLIPLAFVGATCVVAWYWPAARLRTFAIVLAVGIAAYSTSVWAQHELEVMAGEFQSQLERTYESSSVARAQSPSDLDAWREVVEAESARRDELYETVVRRAEFPERLRNVGWVFSQIAIVFVSASILFGIGRGRLPVGWSRRARAALSAFAVASVLIVPFSAFTAVRDELAYEGFHEGYIFMTDCDPETRYEASELLWMGDRALVLRCPSGLRVALRDSGKFLGDRASLADEVWAADDAALRLEEEAWRAEQDRLLPEVEDRE